MEPSSTWVGFSTPNWFNPLSWIVRKISGSKISHTWFVYEDRDFDMLMVMEAHEVGFRLTPFTHFLKYNTVVALFAPKRPLDEGLKVVARKYLSTHYDFGGLLGMAWVKLGRLLKHRWKNPFRDPLHVFCSKALAIAMHEAMGYTDFRDDPETADPEYMMEYFANDGSQLVAPHDLIAQMAAARAAAPDAPEPPLPLPLQAG